MMYNSGQQTNGEPGVSGVSAGPSQAPGVVCSHWQHLKHYEEFMSVDQPLRYQVKISPPYHSFAVVPSAPGIYGMLKFTFNLEMSPNSRNHLYCGLEVCNQLLCKDQQLGRGLLTSSCWGWFIDRGMVRLKLRNTNGDTLTRRFNLETSHIGKESPIAEKGHLRNPIYLLRFGEPFFFNCKDVVDLQAKAVSAGRTSIIQVETDIVIRETLHEYCAVNGLYAWTPIVHCKSWTKGFFHYGFGTTQQRDFCSNLVTALHSEKARQDGITINGKDVDVQFLITSSDVIIGAHRLVLANNSPVLKSMLFDTNMTEKTQGLITLPDVTHTNMKNFLTLLYNNSSLPELMDMSVEDALGVLSLAHKYQVEHVLEFCLWILLSHPNPTLCLPHVVEMYSAGKLYDIPDLVYQVKSWFKWRTITQEGKEEIKYYLKETDPIFARDFLMETF